MWHLLAIKELRTKFWCGKLKKDNHLENVGVDGRVTLKCGFKE